MFQLTSFRINGLRFGRWRHHRRIFAIFARLLEGVTLVFTSVSERCQFETVCWSCPTPSKYFPWRKWRSNQWWHVCLGPLETERVGFGVYTCWRFSTDQRGNTDTDLSWKPTKIGRCCWCWRIETFEIGARWRITSFGNFWEGWTSLRFGWRRRALHACAGKTPITQKLVFVWCGGTRWQGSACPCQCLSRFKGSDLIQTWKSTHLSWTATSLGRFWFRESELRLCSRFFRRFSGGPVCRASPGDVGYDTLLSISSRSFTRLRAQTTAKLWALPMFAKCILPWDLFSWASGCLPFDHGSPTRSGSTKSWGSLVSAWRANLSSAVAVWQWPSMCAPSKMFSWRRVYLMTFYAPFWMPTLNHIHHRSYSITSSRRWASSRSILAASLLQLCLLFSIGLFLRDVSDMLLEV